MITATPGSKIHGMHNDHGDLLGVLEQRAPTDHGGHDAQSQEAQRGFAQDHTRNAEGG